MSATNNLTYNDFATPGYASNVAAAARQLVAALLAVKPQAAAAEPVVSQRSKEETSWWLNRLAKDCEMHSPSLSAELRFFASRG